MAAASNDLNLNLLGRGLAAITGLDKILQKETALKAQLGGIQTHWSASDDLVGDMYAIEQSLSQFNVITRMHRDRKIRYRDYDAMDNYGDISIALDIYAEEATQTDLVKQSNLWITEADPAVAQDIEDFIKRLRLRTQIFGFARQLAKFGDLFIIPRYSTRGVEKILPGPPDKIKRIGTGTDQVKHYQLEDNLKVLSPRKNGVLLPWECIHFRMLSFGFSVLYGRSMLEPARKRWLHLKLLEDAVSIYRLNRAVERIIYYIDVGAADPSEALRLVNNYRRKFSNKRSYIDANSVEQFEMQYDPTNMLENIFWPVNSANERSRIDKLDPPPPQDQLQDLDHFNNKLFLSLGIPKDYLTGDISGAWNSKESLTLQDIRFSRKIHRLQVALIEGIEHLIRFHLAVKWRDPIKAAQVPFQVNLADVSQTARQQYDQILLNRVQLISSLDSLGSQMQLNPETWKRFVLQSFFPDIPKELIDSLLIPDDVLAREQQRAQSHEFTLKQRLSQFKSNTSSSKSSSSKAKEKPKPVKDKKTMKEEIHNSILARLMSRQPQAGSHSYEEELVESQERNKELYAPPSVNPVYLKGAVQSVEKRRKK